jgi:transposase
MKRAAPASGRPRPFARLAGRSRNRKNRAASRAKSTGRTRTAPSPEAIDETHDGWAVYDRFRNATHQQCTAHLLRRCNERLETATGMAARCPQRVKEILQHGLRLRDRFAASEMTAHGLYVMAGRLRSQMESLVAPIKRHAANERFAKFLEAHLDELFAYLRRPEIDATNWRGEQAIRPAVVNRKVWGGNRTWRGAAAQSIVTSILRTLAHRGHAALNWLATALRHPEPLLIPP